jgi:hypothetical protein
MKDSNRYARAFKASRTDGKAKFNTDSRYYLMRANQWLQEARALDEKCAQKRAELFEAEKQLSRIVQMIQHGTANSDTQMLDEAREKYLRINETVRRSFSRTGAKAAFAAHPIPEPLERALQHAEVCIRLMRRAWQDNRLDAADALTGQLEAAVGQVRSSSDHWIRSVKRVSSRTGAKSTNAANEAVSKKIATLTREGYRRDQAVAIAHDMKRRGEI